MSFFFVWIVVVSDAAPIKQTVNERLSISTHKACSPLTKWCFKGTSGLPPSTRAVIIIKRVPTQLNRYFEPNISHGYWNFLERGFPLSPPVSGKELRYFGLLNALSRLSANVIRRIDILHISLTTSPTVGAWVEHISWPLKLRKHFLFSAPDFDYHTKYAYTGSPLQGLSLCYSMASDGEKCSSKPIRGNDKRGTDSTFTALKRYSRFQDNWRRMCEVIKKKKKRTMSYPRGGTHGRFGLPWNVKPSGTTTVRFMIPDRRNIKVVKDRGERRNVDGRKKYFTGCESL